MSEFDPRQTIEELTRDLPRTADGEIDFTKPGKVPIVNVIVYISSTGEILLVKRSNDVDAYKGKWNGVSGLISNHPTKSFREDAVDELREEVSIETSNLRVAEPYEVVGEEPGRIWVVIPVLAELERRPSIRLNWENTDYAFTLPQYLPQYEHVIDLDESVIRTLGLTALRHSDEITWLKAIFYLHNASQR